MQKIIITKGLSGSGKTTWANEYVKENDNFVIVCKDDIRAEFPQGIKEGKVVAKRDELIEKALSEGKSVIVADTNLANYHAYNIYSKFHQKAEIELNDSFLSVSAEECIERTRSRPKPDGTTWEEIILRQKAKYGVINHVEQDENLPGCIITDFDGTLAHMSPFRSPYDGTFQHLDEVNEIVVDYVNQKAIEGFEIIVLSGLSDKYFDLRKEWMIENGILFNQLHMRKEGDMRKDAEIKDDLFKEVIEGKYFVYAILDDRPQMTKYWVDKGFSKRLFSIGNQHFDF